MHVHRSWPKALMMRAARLSNSKAARDAVHSALKRRFTDNYAPTNQLQFLEKETAIRCKKDKKSEGHVVWCSMPYHPVLKSAICKAMMEAACSPSPYMKFLLDSSFDGRAPTFRVCWYSSLPNMEVLLSKV
eukprot:UN0453